MMDVLRFIVRISDRREVLAELHDVAVAWDRAAGGRCSEYVATKPAAVIGGKPERQ
ncbi:MAG: hypothetical protein QM636_27045 [Rhizobium sp.]